MKFRHQGGGGRTKIKNRNFDFGCKLGSKVDSDHPEQYLLSYSTSEFLA